MKVSREIKRLFDKHDISQIKMGIKVEQEHNSGATDVVGSKLDLLKITLAHLEEDPKYYTKLKKVEEKRFTFDEESGIISEAPHIMVGDKVIDFEFEKDEKEGLKKVLKAIIRQEITDKYGNTFKLETDKEVDEFIKKILRNPQIRKYLG